MLTFYVAFLDFIVFWYKNLLTYLLPYIFTSSDFLHFFVEIFNLLLRICQFLIKTLYLLPNSEKLITRCTATWPLRHAALPDNYRLSQTKHFRWWNVFDFDDMCRMGRWSFWSRFDVNRYTFDKDIREKQLLHFRSQWPWPLDLLP